MSTTKPHFRGVRILGYWEDETDFSSGDYVVVLLGGVSANRVMEEPEYLDLSDGTKLWANDFRFYDSRVEVKRKDGKGTCIPHEKKAIYRGHLCDCVEIARKMNMETVIQAS